MKGTMNFLPRLLEGFAENFPQCGRVPSKNAIRKMYAKQNKFGTVLNTNSKVSPGPHSGLRPPVRTAENLDRVKAVLDRDRPKDRGDRDASPSSSCRRNALGISKSSWNRMTKDLEYHPYKVHRRHELLPQDYQKRLDFCNWILTLTDDQLFKVVLSDEANFQLSGHVNSKNVVKYAPTKRSNPEEGGHPENHVHDTPKFDKQIMVFCGVNVDGTFGYHTWVNHKVCGKDYHYVLQYKCLPQLRAWNGGNLDGLTWCQDGASVHTSIDNLAYLDRQFGMENVWSYRRGKAGPYRLWPSRSPDLNPCDYFLWGYLKVRVYCPRPRTLKELEANIRREVDALKNNPALFRRVMLDLRSRAERCVAANGGHFEKK